MELCFYFLFLQEQIKDIIILRTFLNVYMELGFYFLFLQEQKEVRNASWRRSVLQSFSAEIGRVVHGDGA
jgi:hypothetical protein